MIAWPLYQNDRLEDCSTVAMADLILDKLGILLPESAVIDAWKTITGSDPEKGIDKPAVELPVLQYMRDTGMGGVRIKGWTQISHLDTPAVRRSILCSGIYAVLALPEACENDLVWSRTDGEPQGHFVAVTDYNPVGPVCITWGREQQMTWAFWVACVETAVTIQF